MKELLRDSGVADDHIVAGDIKDDFLLEMGDQGPCSSYDELHDELIRDRKAAHLINQNDPNVMRSVT